MRMLRCSPAVLALLSILACGGGKAPGQCQHNFDCAAGQACVAGACAVVPCGGCQADEACGNDGNCVLAQGVSCADHTCPAALPCNAGGTCAKPCTVSQDCDAPLLCNSALKSCTECAFDSQCAGKPGKPVCDTTSGQCTACNVNFDCVKALGSGHYCDAHACKPGCKADADCNATLGETCDTSTNPGRCIQCRSNSDCAAQGPSASACDDTGHCVQCYAATQAAANNFCGNGTPECNLATKSCVACLPSNNASGLDCGYSNNGTMDPHDARTCNPQNLSCVDGCETDAQCGCPHTQAGGTESQCARFPDQEHCDPKRTTMAGVTGTTLGACVQCTANQHCTYKVAGTTLYGGSYGTYNGSRCVSDSCVQGCDADADCWPDHATSNGRICHLGGPADPNDHKCVQCGCDTAGDDPSWCNSALCASGKVCDTTTLSCRKKHEGETCEASTECGALVDPTSPDECLPLTGSGSGFCAIHSNNEAPDKYCSASHGPPGRCAAFTGAGTCTCPTGSASKQASNTEGGWNQVCFPASCSY